MAGFCGENVHCSGQRVYENTKIKLSLGAKAIIIISIIMDIGPQEDI
jgi:hypothetical protein